MKTRKTIITHNTATNQVIIEKTSKKPQYCDNAGIETLINQLKPLFEDYEQRYHEIFEKLWHGIRHGLVEVHDEEEFIIAQRMQWQAYEDKKNRLAVMMSICKTAIEIDNSFEAVKTFCAQYVIFKGGSEHISDFIKRRYHVYMRLINGKNKLKVGDIK